MSKELALEALNHSFSECAARPGLASYEMLYVQSSEELLQVEKHIYGTGIREICVDTETTGLDAFTANLVLIQILAGNTIFLINVPRLGEAFLQNSSYSCIRRILEDKNILKIAHNFKFDLKFPTHFLSNPHLWVKNIFDTHLAEQLLNAGRDIEDGFSLKALAKRYLNLEMDKTEQISFRDGNLTQKQLDYASNDVIVLKPIHEKQLDALTEAGLLPVAQLKFSIIPAIADIEQTGMKIELQKLEALKEKYRNRLKTLEAELEGIICKLPVTGQLTLLGPRINYNSCRQVKQVLSYLGYRVENTDIETLERIPHPFAQKLVQHRRDLTFGGFNRREEQMRGLRPVP